MAVRTKRILQASAGIAFAAWFLYLATRKIQPSELWNTMRSAHLWYLAPILLLHAAFFWLKAIRWGWLLRPVKPLRVREVFPALMIGFMGNNLLPAHLGEFVRMYVLARQYGISKSAVLSTIVLERILDFLAIAGILAVSLQLIPASEGLAVFRTGGYIVGGLSVLVFLLFILYVARTDAFMRCAASVLAVAPRPLRERALSVMRVGGQGLYSLRSPYLLASAIGITIIHWGANGLTHYLAAISFPLDAPLPPVAGYLLLCVMALAITLPSAPGYVGTTQWCFTVALGGFGVAEPTAFSASLYATAVGYVPVTATGLFFMARLGLKFRNLTEDAKL